MLKSTLIMNYNLQFSSKDKEILKPIYAFAKARRVTLYLVGGILRDMLLGRVKQNPDFDFCLNRGAINFGRLLAKEIRAGFVVLDKEHGACRLVKKAKAKIYTLDFTDFRGKTLKKDLLHRDFTVNALALELKDVFIRGNLDNLLIDPYGGRDDLKFKTIKMVNIRAFDEDPLRILRAFSLSAISGFKIEKQTFRLARLKREKLTKVSFERIRDEMFKILQCHNSFDYLNQMDKLKILQVILPEIIKMRRIGQGPYHHLDVWQHTLETIRQLEILYKEVRSNHDIQQYLDQIISSERSRKTVLKLGALLHDIGKPAALRREEGKIKFHGHERIGLGMTEDIGRRFKLSVDEINTLRKIVLWHLRPGYLAGCEVLTPRAKFRYFRDADQEAISTLLLSLADQRATKGPLTTKNSRVKHEKVCKSLMREYFKKKKEKKPKRLINGDILIKKFKLEPSPLIGKILSEIEELQAIGKISTKPQALEAARKILGTVLISKK